MSETHFTAVIEITKTVHKEPTTTYRGGEAKPAERGVQEVARIVVRADTLESLVAKAGAHLALVEEN